MHWSENLERVARTLLWLTLAAVCVMVPVSLAKQRDAEERLKAVVENTEAKLAEALKPKGPARMPTAHLGSIMTALNRSTGEGSVWFTNVSPTGGIVCLRGIATNAAGDRKARSMPACQMVEPYSSAHIKVMFAGTELDELCKAAPCDLDVKEEPDATH